MPLSGINVVAQWTPSTWTTYYVKHYCENIAWTWYDLVEIEELSWTTDTLVTPDRIPYEWFTAPDGIEINIDPDGNALVSYYYTRKSYDIIYNVDWWVFVDNQSVKFEDAPEERVTSKTWYTFMWWLDLPSSMPAHNVNVTALWDANTWTEYKVIHIYTWTNDWLSWEVVEVKWHGTSDSYVTWALAPRDWFVNPEESQVYINSDWSGSMTYIYERREYTLSYNSNGWTPIDSISIKYGELTDKSPRPTRTWYTFLEWTWADRLPLNGTTLIAQWTPNTGTEYHVEHYKQNIDWTYSMLPSEIDVLYGTSDVQIEPGVNTYTWFTAPSKQTVIINPDGSLVVKYEYTRNSYDVSYDANGWILVSWVSVKFEDTVPAPITTKTWYQFSGWQWIPSDGKMPATWLNLVAEWIANTWTEYNVVHIYTWTNDGITSIIETVIHNGTTDTLVTWQLLPRDGFITPVEEQVWINPDGSATMTYIYERTWYTLSYNTNWWTPVDPVIIIYWALNDTWAVTTKTWYTFVEWSWDVRMPLNGTTLEAIWEANTWIVYTVKHYLGNISDTWYTLDDVETKYWVSGEPTQASWKSYSWFEIQPFVQQSILWDWSTVVEIYYNREVYTITFEIDSGVTITYTWKYESPITAPDDPTRTWYRFVWWQPAVPATMPLDGLTITAKREQKSTQWGWSQLKKDYCPDGDFSNSYYDGTCWVNSNDNQNTEHWSAWDEEPIDSWDIYDDEVLEAYKWAYANDITTIDSFEKADPDWYLLRWHMAKMVVNFMVNVLWFEIPDDVPEHCLSFNDNPAIWESEEIKDYAIKSCALWIMWIDMVNNEFLPNDIVSRAEFGTITSRILWWTKYNVKHTIQHPYYVKHLNALKAEEIMTKIDNPLLWKELRKWVWVVFKRVSDK